VQQSFAQCTVNAGNDTALCEFKEIQLGGNLVVSGGVEPYTYTWYIDPSENESQSISVNASDILDDTTIAHLTLLSPENSPIILRVTDAENSVCEDTIHIYSPVWFITLEQKIREVPPGTPIQLYSGVLSNSQLSYEWSPTVGLDDPTIEMPIAITDTSITYNLLLTDSAGCQMKDEFYVMVTETNILDVVSDDTVIVINTSDSFNFIGTSEANTRLQLFDINGKMFFSQQFNNEGFSISKSLVPNGVYMYVLRENNKYLASGIIINE
jgi:hypothetical protein